MGRECGQGSVEGCPQGGDTRGIAPPSVTGPQGSKKEAWGEFQGERKRERAKGGGCLQRGGDKEQRFGEGEKGFASGESG